MTKDTKDAAILLTGALGMFLLASVGQRKPSTTRQGRSTPQPRR